jgi:hypothetical protein
MINPPVKLNGSAKLSADIAKEDKGEKRVLTDKLPN